MNENRSDAAGLTTTCAQAASNSEAPVASLHTYDIYTDGSALVGAVSKGGKAEGPCGWAYVIVRSDGRQRMGQGGLLRGTNSRAEMQAVIEALSVLPENRRGVVRSDSVFVVRGMTAWRAAWEARSFKDVKNTDLWRQLYTLADVRPGIRFEWVKGHADNTHNNRADRLARKAAMAMQENGASKLATSLNAAA